jgi:hypothetical protein
MRQLLAKVVAGNIQTISLRKLNLTTRRWAHTHRFAVVLSMLTILSRGHQIISMNFHNSPEFSMSFHDSKIIFHGFHDLQLWSKSFHLNTIV